jgi:hypothetical protein
MATAAASAARGPLNALLSNASTQWIVIGVGIYTFGPDSMRDAVHRAIAAATTPGPHQNHHDGVQQYRGSGAPVIVRIDSSNSGGSGGNTRIGWMTTIVSYTALVGGVWVSYSFLATMLPEQLKQILPVTRQVFEKSSKSLAKTIYNVKEVLGNQINQMLRKQEELEDQQKDTHQEILNVHVALKSTREDVQTVNRSTIRCEDDLKRSIAMQGYTARGVKLLVTAVSSILAPDNRITQELEDYLRAGELVYGGGNNNNNNNIRNGKKPSALGPEEDRPGLAHRRPTTPPKKIISPISHQHELVTPDDCTISTIRQGTWLQATH